MKNQQKRKGELTEGNQTSVIKKSTKKNEQTWINWKMKMNKQNRIDGKIKWLKWKKKWKNKIWVKDRTNKKEQRQTNE